MSRTSGSEVDVSPVCEREFAPKGPGVLLFEEQQLPFENLND